MADGLTLVCPVRGLLKAKGRSADGLKPSEERFRVEAIRHLIGRGYPVENIKVEAVVKRFGNSGRNNLRADLAVLDVAVATITSGDVDAMLAHALVLVEVKRDNADADAAKSFQVRPMLDFASRDDCVALYWDDIEQRVYWYEREGTLRVAHDGPLVALPSYGQKPAAPLLTFAMLDSDKPLLDAFRRIEDILHSASIGPSKRYGVILQLLLAKLYDEHGHAGTPDAPLELQDFTAIGVDPIIGAERFGRVLAEAVRYYQSFLPETVSEKLGVLPSVLNDILRILAPIKIVAMRQSVIQDFYMYFARHLYKWDMAQYFTPTSLTDFIVEVLNPGFGEHVRDPACGSADFLTAAFRRGSHYPDYASCVWGSDVSPEAVQVAVLNMILNGDGKTNISDEDSLVKVESHAASCEVVVCNPPFGTSIVDRRASVLADFDLGHVWKADDGGALVMQNELLRSQETGILFAELCVRTVRPGGRIGLIVPNGYLGNTSAKYWLLRDWLLRRCRITAIVAFPRFTFKGSGADVSASVLFLEKRQAPLANVTDDDEYEMSVEVVNRVGWDVGNKKAGPLWLRDPEDGTFLLTDDGDLMPDTDFPDTLRAIRTSDAAQFFPWLTSGIPQSAEKPGWSVPISTVTGNPYLTCDPKRLCRKMTELRAAIEAVPHFRLGNVLEPVAEGDSSDGGEASLEESKVYRYVELGDTESGTYRWTLRRGWDLPSRARHLAEPGDLYLGSIWGSVRKWLYVGEDASDLVVTNGFIRARVKAGKEQFLVDIMAGLCSEAYATQMRAFARGSDGLAQVTEDDAMNVLLPRITSRKARADLAPLAEQLRKGYNSAEATIASLEGRGLAPLPDVPRRPDHTPVV